MPGIPRRYSHYVFGLLQSGLTTGVASAIGVYPQLAQGAFLARWLTAWGIAWTVMLPVVILAAPGLRRFAEWLTTEV
jgi:hypothetical protein